MQMNVRKMMAASRGILWQVVDTEIGSFTLFIAALHYTCDEFIVCGDGWCSVTTSPQYWDVSFRIPLLFSGLRRLVYRTGCAHVRVANACDAGVTLICR